ncbi:TM2 domain-containing protein almondex [Operophtera brumata]|uniref:TM2 domain-containing protein almondex n=1 Tax=Operophtera brumata TaxID=104452 RepID=A0A0L7LLF6_OPEBR|nr:TM2 domain-containing protein almondex [Operophtera brumata]
MHSFFHSSENPHEISQDNRSRNSVDSTQGYQDSDFSPAKVNATRKKKLSLTVKKGNRVQRKSFRASLVISPDISQNSSNSSYFVPKKPKSQSTLDSAIYKTESYQILMENRKHSTKKLDVIEETKNEDLRHFNALSKESNDSNIVIEVGSSSNVSLPLSPELSLVENITLSHEIIQNDYQPTINETQAGTSSIGSNISNQYLITDVDISIPLMQQTCELLSTRKDEISSKKLAKKTKPPKSPIKVSELLNKVTAVTSVNNTLSDSLDRKLRDLLLESAQKITAGNKENHMDVDESVVEPKTREKKRCSTPLKKNVTKKTKVVMGPVIDEHMESCSHGGRKSCPPAIDFIPVNENANNSEDVQLKVYKPNPKTRVKKDIIKVKIQRPKNKKRSAEKVTTSVASTNPSVELRCSINETESLSGVLLGTTDSESVELIHNHSETCLQAHECIGDSIEFVESSKSDSIISANSTASLESELVKVMKYVDNLTPTDTIYNSPVPFNSSLITEDLSDEKPTSPSKWYLFSEDDTNTNIANNRQENMTSNTSVSNYSASLLRLFPIACAVPNLSTVSENSKENEDTNNNMDVPRKEGKTKEDSNEKDVSFSENDDYSKTCPIVGNEDSLDCISLNYPCITCERSIDCRYGSLYNYTCKVKPNVGCKGTKAFNRTAMCRFCYQTDKWEHRCDHKANCNSLASPLKYYLTNCTVSDDILCLGKRRFRKKIKCSWTAGTRWGTALILALTLGGFGADRFYLGHWQEGIGKLFSFGGLGVWTLVDALLIGIHHLGPADGSLYI